MLTELKSYPQWVIWRVLERDGKAVKVPFSPKSGRPASVTNPDEWSSYEDAVSAAEAGKAAGIGFVLTEHDPFCFIDLDATDDPEVFALHKQVFDRIPCYAEVSPSGKGLHLICRATVGKGTRKSREKIEIYDRERYMTVTGSVYRDAPAVDAQETVSSLLEFIAPNREEKSGNVPTVEVMPGVVAPDEEVLEQAKKAQNGDKFLDLWEGRWQEHYGSQSEADLALINILAFYTDSKDQVRRLFLQSALGQRDKAKIKGYLQGMLDKSFDQKLPPINFDLVRKQFVGEKEEEEESDTNFEFDCNLPGGLIEDLALFTFQASPRPNQEVALATAIAIMAGICGRSWNVSGTGLNQYIFLIGQTGIGKDAINVGMGKIAQVLGTVLPASKKFWGPSEISSPQALNRYLAEKSSCFVAYTGEIGKKLQEMQRPNASSSLAGLHRMALNLYAASGHGKVVESTIYSDREKNIAAMISPSFTWFGESTPDVFYGSLTQDMIRDGLIPRFLIIETTRKRPPLNQNHINQRVPDQLAGRMANLASMSLANEKADVVTQVMLEREAAVLFDRFNEFCDDRINKAMDTHDAVRSQLWNRAHLKALKLAALVAVGKNHMQPVISADDAKWAIGLEKWEVGRITRRFDSGEILADSLDEQQISTLKKRIKHYLTSSPNELKSAIKGFEGLHHAKVIPLSYLMKTCFGLTAFRSDRNGATNAIRRSLKTMIDSGELREVNSQTMSNTFGKTCIGYVVVLPMAFGMKP